MQFIEDFFNKHRKDGLAERGFKGLTVAPYIKEIAALRVNVLREFPYFYKTTLSDEVKYIEKTYLSSNDSNFLLFLSASGVAGGIGVTPLSCMEELADVFTSEGHDASDYMFAGEAMLFEEYRGRGLLKKMLAFAEECASGAGQNRKNRQKFVSFQTVERPSPRGNQGEYMLLDSFWEEYGYSKIMSGVEKKWLRVETGKIETNRLSFWRRAVSVKI